MATTTNYGWTTPDDTALVKDGAAAIRTLGSSVDTTTKNLNPETTLGDISYRSSTANVKTRLPLGTAGQVLKVNSGATAPEWATDASGMTNPMTTTGDTIYSSSGSTPARLGIGTTGQVLTVAGGLPSWATASSGAMTKIVSTTFSAVASQQFLNCFNSTYKSYFIEFSNIFDSGAVATPTVQISWYYSTSTDIGNGEYRGGTMYISQTGVPTTGQTTNGGQAFWSFGRASGAGTPAGGYLNVSSAGALGGSGNQYMNFQAQGMWIEGGDGDATDWRTWVGGSYATVNQAITGFKIALSGGNVSGTIVVYGLEK